MIQKSHFYSIIIPCYNQAHFLQDAVNSIIQQGFQDWELLIVNDGSTDETQQCAELYVSGDNRIKLINKENGGLSSARNAGLREAVGEVVLFLDADDYILKDCLGVVHDYFVTDAAIDLFRVGYQYVDEKNRNVIHDVTPGRVKDYSSFVLQNNLGPCHSIFIKRKLAINLGWFDETLKSCEDWDFWIRAVKAGARINIISKILVCYRYVNNSMSRNAFRMYEALKTVTERASKKDERIVISSGLNNSYKNDIDSLDGLKFQLLRCIGVSIMQGQINESVELYLKEKFRYNWKFRVEDYSRMSSYLSFRYFVTPEEIKRVFSEILPRFEFFFSRLGLSRTEMQPMLRIIFKTQYQKQNHSRFGRIIGGLVNRIYL